MAYLHCHSCHWEQDDFWSEGYNPISFKLWDAKDLLESDLDKSIGGEHPEVTLREAMAKYFESKAKDIRNMVYRTEKEFREKNPEKKCPKCGKQELDID